uniref:Thiaminase-2/PQQC domain-containing protein n=1 Tax=Chaetoceros debilis TaxID=122233 RepID=A0A7S3PYL4_9STRA|mmetsp:Transcript_15683/g.23489  ORF Transcript_15683/g.23489 Transcript_15683/m.23489 type:complete len:231 (+) Transcript_15683:136-828(+)|eukprot:CAMPEP_0194073570 /NCGR_PEP_ID=MMETSP0149-20130528/945_1 /TAXON_ID=122233 /ORGANISM="Chaetoceros debilis, Strain MM31A-1" /LENGTH=230 /DNA_ID=CAMNT_0038753601 /DNA_START=90 /DNA_END=782 /DNA_ORIENTATION=+
MSKRLWKAAQDLIEVTEKHRFLSAMVDGTLDEDKFKYYAVQDALYLTDFAACLHRLGDKAAAIKPEHSERLHSLARGAEEDEKELHRSFFKKWNISDIQEDGSKVKATPNTLLYTSYMIRVVSTKSYAEGLAVLLPCFWVYMHVGKCMLKFRDELGKSVKRIPQYDAWIDMYASDEFEKEVTDYIRLVDDVAKDLDEDTIDKMEEHFIMSCKLEHMFWDSAENLTEWPQF